MTDESWRANTARELSELGYQIGRDAATRYRSGMVEHGPVFHGDPLEQCQQELTDALFYLHMARKERDALIEELHEPA